MPHPTLPVVIFDLDGTLIDSQELYRTSYNNAFHDMGYRGTINREDWIEYAIHAGFSSHDWFKHLGVTYDVHHFRERVQFHYFANAPQLLKILPGAGELVKLLHLNGVKLGLASHSNQKIVDTVLEEIGLTPYFHVALSDYAAKRRKPHPDIYLLVAEKLGAAPDECIVIEDSLGGLKAVKQAGMRCIICPDTYSALPVESYRGADLMVESLTQVSMRTLANLHSGQ